MKDLNKLEKKLNLFFKNKDLLTQAFCHRSYLNEHPDFSLGHNERLEFLGDAVLELIVTEYLFNNYPQKAEGELTVLRSALVNTYSLSKVASDLEFNNFLLQSVGESKEKGRARQFILANTFEAFIGALYLDQGYKICQNFIQKFLIEKYLPEIIEKKLFKDPKSLFQEKAQEIEKITPVYKLIKEIGPDHQKHFIVGVYLEDKLIAEGQGPSKQEAETEAAKKALEIKGW